MDLCLDDDSLIFKNEEYFILHKYGVGLYNFTDFGFKMSPFYKGDRIYYMVYTIKDHNLYLTKIEISGHYNQLPAIQGGTPQYIKSHIDRSKILDFIPKELANILSGYNVYDLDLFTQYSGTIIAGKDEYYFKNGDMQHRVIELQETFYKNIIIVYIENGNIKKIKRKKDYHIIK